jgi:ABC-type transport system involved in multi-copper enzyme maturation permease subunit
MREEMRSRKIFFLGPIFVGILSIVALVAIGDSSGSSFNPLAQAGASRLTLFASVITITIVLGLIAVVFGASSFTTEREKATFELLELTPLSRMDLVMGKFLHAMTITGLVLFSSLPIFSSLFFMGGVTYSDLLLTLFYLIVFFSVVILGTICISIVSNKTILSIILSLATVFVISVALGIMSMSASRDPSNLGFSVISPWLVTYQQIFDPAPLRILGLSLPMWPFYLLIYALVGILFLTWARNALDTRKVERNRKARIFGLLLVNSYLAIGLLCLKSYSPIREATMIDFYNVLFYGVMATLVFFVLGGFTERDHALLIKRPLLESIHPAKLFLNSPTTGPAYLAILLITVSLTFAAISGLRLRLIFGYLVPFGLWIVPWVLIFSAMRLAGFRQRAFFGVYAFGTILYIILSIFLLSGKASAPGIEFFMFPYCVGFLWIAAIVFHIIMRVRLRSRHMVPVSSSV